MECSDQGLAHKYLPRVIVVITFVLFSLLSFWVREYLLKEETLRQKRGTNCLTSMTQIPEAVFHSGGETPSFSESCWIWILPVEQAPWPMIILLQALASSTVQGSLTPMPYRIPPGEKEVGTLLICDSGGLSLKQVIPLLPELLVQMHSRLRTTLLSGFDLQDPQPRVLWYPKRKSRFFFSK